MDADSEEILDFLAEEGYRARAEPDGAIRFKSEGQFIILQVSQVEGMPALATSMGLFCRHDGVADAVTRARVLTEQMTVIKASVPEQGVVCFVAEQCGTLDSFKLTFELILDGLHVAARKFFDPSHRTVDGGNSDLPTTATGYPFG
jgi:hypothetical protein